MLKRFLALIFTFLSCGLLASAITLRALQHDSPPPLVRVYKTASGTGLKLYIVPPARTAGSGPFPAFVWIHGGGWTAGDATSGLPHARYFASRGMASFSVEYRLARSGGPSIGDALADCKSAMRYIRTHAAEFGVDERRIAVAGDSAGAHLAAALGTVDGFDDEGDDLGISALPNAMLLYNGIYDLTEGDRGALAGAGSASRDLSPLLHVRKGQPPAIVLHGLDDTVVSPDQSRRFAKAMKDAGNPCELIMVENARHAFVMPDYTAPERVVVQAIRDGDAFLTSLGYLHGEATLEALAPSPRL